jgi:two-component system sensor histidine kinase VicK
MFKGGTAYNQRAAQIIRYAGLTTPIILVLYGVLIQNGVLAAPHYSNDIAFIVIALVWMLLSAWQFLSPSDTRRASAFRLISYHVLAGLYLLFVSGPSVPFTIFWILLFVASNIYFSKRGLMLSVLAFMLTIGTDIVIATITEPSSSVILNDFMVIISVLVTGLAVVAVGRTQEVDRSALNRSQAQESLQRDRILTIVNNLADAVLSTDKNGIIRVYNAASLNLLDTNDSLNGHHIDEILTVTDKEGDRVHLFDELLTSHSVTVRDDLHMTFDEDEVVRLEITYSPIRSSYSRSKDREDHDGYIIIMRDITKAKSLEEERDEFISVVSHELRTPITIAEGTISNAQLILSRPDVKQEVLVESIKNAHDQVIFLAKMVNDLSTLSRAERGIADVTEEIEVRPLVDKLYNEYLPQAEAKKLHLNLDADAKLGTISASRLYVEELLQNFITNAIKYTREGSITLRVHLTEDIVEFAVSDTGIGISKNEQRKIFQKFYRSEDYRTRETGGTGLGLYVAAKLARKLGCTIELESRLNHGSTFSFSLPVIVDKND